MPPEAPGLPDPCASSSPIPGIGPCSFAQATLALALDGLNAKAWLGTTGGHFAPYSKLLLNGTAIAADLEAATVGYALGLTDQQLKILDRVSGAGSVLLFFFPEAVPIVALAVTSLALGMWATDDHSDFIAGVHIVRNDPGRLIHVFFDQLTVLGGFFGLIDPSDNVVDVNGTPVSGATVTLLRQGDDGTYAAVPQESWMIDPHVNPQTTTQSGAFSWMAAAGTYRVRATSAACTDQAGGPASTEGGPYVLPPPALGLQLALPCHRSTSPQLVRTRSPSPGPNWPRPRPSRWEGRTPSSPRCPPTRCR